MKSAESALLACLDRVGAPRDVKYLLRDALIYRNYQLLPPYAHTTQLALEDRWEEVWAEPFERWALGNDLWAETYGDNWDDRQVTYASLIEMGFSPTEVMLNCGRPQFFSRSQSRLALRMSYWDVYTNQPAKKRRKK